MPNYHEVLINQLQRLNIDLTKLPLDSLWLKLLDVISHTYQEFDEHRYALERSIEISSEEIDQSNMRYESELTRINAVTFDGIIITTDNWNISSLNHRATSILDTNEEEFINGYISDKLLFLNSQKELLDFSKLQHHFECGNNYVCPKGVMINLAKPNHLFFASFTIAPFYMNDILNSYVIIFRDISQEIYAESERTLGLLKKENLFKKKEQSFISSAQELLANNHNSAFATQLHQYLGSLNTELIQSYIISQAIESNTHLLNQMLIDPVQSENQSFYISNVIPELYKGITELISSKEFKIENYIKKALRVSSYQFVDVIYECIEHCTTIIKSANITNLDLIPMDSSSTYQPWVIARITLKSVYFISNDLIADKLEKIRKKSSSQWVDSVNVSGDNHELHLSFHLKMPVANSELTKESNKTQGLRCILFLEEGSDLVAQLNKHFLLNYMDVVETHTAEETVKYIKEGRLNKSEYNIIISDIKDYRGLEDQVLHEISSYINNQFLGVIYLSNEQPPLSERLKMRIHNLPNNPTMDEMRILLYSLRAQHLQQTSTLAIPDLTFPQYNRRILFIDLEPYSQSLYLELFEKLNFKLCLASLTGLDTQLLQSGFEAVFINAGNDIASLAPVLEQINAVNASLPIYLFTAPLQDHELTEVISYKIDQYLTKPFSLNEFLLLIQNKFS